MGNLKPTKWAVMVDGAQTEAVEKLSQSKGIPEAEVFRRALAMYLPTQITVRPARVRGSNGKLIKKTV